MKLKEIDLDNISMGANGILGNMGVQHAQIFEVQRFASAFVESGYS